MGVRPLCAVPHRPRGQASLNRWAFHPGVNLHRAEKTGDDVKLIFLNLAASKPPPNFQRTLCRPIFTVLPWLYVLSFTGFGAASLPAGGEDVLSLYPTVPCWRGEHAAYAVFSLFILLSSFASLWLATRKLRAIWHLHNEDPPPCSTAPG